MKGFPGKRDFPSQKLSPQRFRPSQPISHLPDGKPRSMSSSSPSSLLEARARGQKRKISGEERTLADCLSDSGLASRLYKEHNTKQRSYAPNNMRPASLAGQHIMPGIRPGFQRDPFQNGTQSGQGGGDCVNYLNRLFSKEGL